MFAKSWQRCSQALWESNSKMHWWHFNRENTPLEWESNGRSSPYQICQKDPEGRYGIASWFGMFDSCHSSISTYIFIHPCIHKAGLKWIETSETTWESKPKNTVQPSGLVLSRGHGGWFEVPSPIHPFPWKLQGFNKTSSRQDTGHTKDQTSRPPALLTGQAGKHTDRYDVVWWNDVRYFFADWKRVYMSSTSMYIQGYRIV